MKKLTLQQKLTHLGRLLERVEAALPSSHGAPITSRTARAELGEARLYLASALLTPRQRVLNYLAKRTGEKRQEERLA